MLRVKFCRVHVYRLHASRMRWPCFTLAQSITCLAELASVPRFNVLLNKNLLISTGGLWDQPKIIRLLSAAVPAADTMRRTAHSRQNFAVAMTPPPEVAPGKQPLQARSDPAIHYTCFIRLPFLRPENFPDPPPVVWDAVKDKALWKLISKASNSRDLDWEAIAVRFEVDLPFLLQQAAWLYERHFEGMKKQMQKLGVSATSSAAPSPMPPESASASGTAAAVGSVSMQRTASKGKCPNHVLEGDGLIWTRFTIAISCRGAKGSTRRSGRIG